MLTRPVRLEAVQEKYSTKWHHVHATFLYLFEGWYISHVEQWYNTIAPVAHRESFRRTMKSIHLHEPSSITEMFQVCKGNNMVRLYNEGMSAVGKEKARSWVTKAASPTEVEAFRDVFTGIQATFTAKSRMKESFVYRPLTDTPTKDAHRQKIDWSSTKAAELAQLQKRDGIASAEASNQAAATGTRLPQLKAGRRANSSMSAEDKTSEEQKMAALQAKRSAFEQSEKYSVDPVTGCSIFTATVGNKRDGAGASKARIMPSFVAGGGSTSWISTTREHIRNYGVRGLQANEKVNPELHPAIARQTASVGLCVPSQSTGDYLSYSP